MIETLGRRSERGRTRGADAVWHGAHQMHAPPPVTRARRSQRRTYRVVLAACVAVLVAAGSGLGLRSATDVGSAVGEVGAPLPHAPVVVRGMAMTDAHDGADLVVSEAGSAWDVYIARDGIGAGIVMLATSRDSLFDIRAAGIGPRELAESMELGDDGWILAPTSRFDGPVESFGPATVDGLAPTDPEYRYGFSGADDHQVVLTALEVSMFEALWLQMEPEVIPVVHELEVLGHDGFALTSEHETAVIWNDGTTTFTAISYRTHGSGVDAPDGLPLEPERLATRMQLAEVEEWRAMVDDARPDYGEPWPVLARRGAIALGVLGVLGVFVRRWWRSRFSGDPAPQPIDPSPLDEPFETT